MRTRMLTIAALALLLSFPLIAQTPAGQVTPETSDEFQPQEADTLDADADVDVNEETNTVSAEASVDVDTDQELADDTYDADALPSTASPLALLALLGLGGAGTAFGIRLRRK
jgi:hypothetical protein